MSEQSATSILYDHYKDTFSSLRERERERDRLFLFLIAVFAVLALQVVYPLQFGGVVEALALGSTRVSIGAAPAAAVLSATWFLASAIALRYCQRVVWIERQYDYLHALERRLGNLLDEAATFRREGSAYLKDAPLFQDWAWLLYVLVFPTIAILSVSALLTLEWGRLGYPLAHLVLDTAVSLTLVGTLYLYRLHPPQDIVRRLRSVSWRSSSDSL